MRPRNRLETRAADIIEPLLGTRLDPLKGAANYDAGMQIAVRELRAQAVPGLTKCKLVEVDDSCLSCDKFGQKICQLVLRFPKAPTQISPVGSLPVEQTCLMTDTIPNE